MANPCSAQFRGATAACPRNIRARRTVVRREPVALRYDALRNLARIAMSIASIASHAIALLVLGALASPVLAQNVKVTPLGSHAGELCSRDRATLFEDPTGVRLLYDVGAVHDGSRRSSHRGGPRRAVVARPWRSHRRPEDESTQSRLV